MTFYDTAVVGAGMAGLTCAQQLHQMGYQVVVLDKSRGVGGRIATRRVAGTVVDHGARYLESQGPLTDSLLQVLLAQGRIQPWREEIYTLQANQPLRKPMIQDPATGPEPLRYMVSNGITGIPKFLAQGLTLRLGQRVTALNITARQTWQIQMEPAQPDPPEDPAILEAGSLVIAIPAPQALDLLTPLAEQLFPEDALNPLRSVTYEPCLSILAGYSENRQRDLEYLALPWRAIECPGDPYIQWLGWDHAKRSQPSVPIFVVNTAAAFAQKYLEVPDLQSAGEEILAYAAEALEIPWLTRTTWMQVHRWRFAFPKKSLSLACWVAPSSPLLICTGDWCEGRHIEAALRSGLAASTQVNHHLRDLPANGNPWEFVRTAN